MKLEFTYFRLQLVTDSSHVVEMLQYSKRVGGR